MSTLAEHVAAIEFYRANYDERETIRKALDMELWLLASAHLKEVAAEIERLRATLSAPVAAQPAAFIVDGGTLGALDRAMARQEAIAQEIDLANPGDHYASLIVREDIEVLEALRAHLNTVLGMNTNGEKRHKLTTGAQPADTPCTRCTFEPACREADRCVRARIRSAPPAPSESGGLLPHTAGSAPQEQWLDRNPEYCGCALCRAARSQP